MPLPYLFGMAKDCLRANVVYMIFEVLCFVNTLSLSCTVYAIIIHASGIMECEKVWPSQFQVKYTMMLQRVLDKM
jgi:hypothetical protein